jgi:hypothetical protein
MAMEPPKASPETMAAVAALSSALSQVDRREAFLSDPEETLKEAGVSVEAIPGELLDHLRGMSSDELRMLADLSERMIAAGLYYELPDGGKVCFF